MNENPIIPEKTGDLELKKQKAGAAGFQAIGSSVRHILDEMSLLKGFKALNKLNQFDGYDCPGCAWPDPDVKRSKLGEYCENGAKAIAEEATDKIVDASFFSKNSIESLLSMSDYELGKSGRIYEPMYLGPGETHYKPISWEDSFKLIGQEIDKLDNPDRAVFYTSGRTSNEAAFLYQLFVRCLGTNNLPDCSNMCHESSGVALTETIGIGKGTVKLEDFYKTDLIIIAGQNPGTNHPRMLSALEIAKDNGAKILSINPLKEAGLMAFADPQSPLGLMGNYKELTDVYLQVKINTDMALFQAFNKKLIQDGKINETFIKDKTIDFDSLCEELKNKDLEQLINFTGLSRDIFNEAYKLIAQSENIILCWAMGWTQHKNAVETIQEGVNLLLLKGSIGKPFAGLCPVRGHSNVQGDRTMGIYEQPGKSFLDRQTNYFNVKMPYHHGYDVVSSIKAMDKGLVDVFICMGGNFISATPDTEFTAVALRKTKLTVQISTKLNRSHLITGEQALILPCLGRSDLDLLNDHKQFVTCENSMGIIQKSQGHLIPVSPHLMSEPAIVVGLANSVTQTSGLINWNKYLRHYDEIRNDIEAIIPGFSDYNQRVRMNGGFYLPNGARENDFQTKSGKARFSINTYQHINILDGEFILMTIRSHDQFNTTIYGMNDRYRGIYNERRVIFLNPLDMEKQGLKSKDMVNITSFYDDQKRIVHNFLVIPYDIPQNCAASYYPETNPLISVNETAKRSNTPISKSVIIRIEKHVGQSI